MSEWEPAPRLSEALERKANSIEHHEGAWHDFTRNHEANRSQILFADETEPVTEIEQAVFVEPTAPAAPSRFLLLAAAAVALVVVVAAAASRADEPIETAAAIGQQCSAFTSEPTVFASSFGVPVAISSDARINDDLFRTHDPVVIDTTGSIRTTPHFSTLVSADLQDASQVAMLEQELIASRCGFLGGAPRYLITSGEFVEAGAGCPVVGTGTGLSGLLVVGPLSPPVGCTGNTTVLFVDSSADSEAAVAAWREKHNCVELTCSPSLEVHEYENAAELSESLNASLTEAWNR